MKSGRPLYGSQEGEAEILERIVYLRTRNGKKKLSYQQIANLFNAERIPTREGGEWSLALIHHFYKMNCGSILNKQAG